MFIAHDILVVRHISDRIAVMYLGKVVELADAKEIYDQPLHPYSKSLLSAVPIPDPETARKSKRIVLSGIYQVHWIPHQGVLSGLVAHT